MKAYRQVALNRKAGEANQGLLKSKAYESDEFLFFNQWGKRLGMFIGFMESEGLVYGYSFRWEL